MRITLLEPHPVAFTPDTTPASPEPLRRQLDAGDVIEIPDDLAERWIVRGIAAPSDGPISTREIREYDGTRVPVGRVGGERRAGSRPRSRG